MRIIFMGTPDFSVPILETLANAGHDIVACYSQPPRPAGRRGLEIKKSPVHQAADAIGIEVRTPVSLKGEDEQRAFAALQADVAVVVAYGLLLPKPVLEGTKHGCFNGHASLLPRWRGAAPIQRAIMAGDAETGMMVMKMDEGLDTGDIALTQIIPIAENMTAGELHDRLSLAGARLMAEAMKQLESGTLQLEKQAAEGVLYASKIDKAEARINFSKQAQQTHNMIRGLSPFPGAWCEMQFGEGKWERVKIFRSQCDAASKLAQDQHEWSDDGLAVGCSEGAVVFTQLQKAGSKAMSAEDFARGAKVLAVR